MSYHIVKGIKINEKEKKVSIKGADNNVYPRDYEWHESNYFGKMLQEKGKNAVELEIFRMYESGNFQAGTENKYTRALKILRYDPEYKRFNWQCGGIGKEYDEINERRKTDEFTRLLKKALKTKLPKTKYIIEKSYYDNAVYLRKITKKSARWTREKIEAKVFRFKEECELLKGCFYGGDEWLIQQII